MHPISLQRPEILELKAQKIQEVDNSLQVLRGDMIVSAASSHPHTSTLIQDIQQKSSPDVEHCLLAVVRYLRGCMVLSFTCAHFDEVLSRCITQEANSSLGEIVHVLDPQWATEISNLADLLDCMAVACPEE